MRIIFVFLLTLISAFPLAAQSERELLEWNEYYRLSWEDFQGKPQEGTFGDAGTAVHIKAMPYMIGKSLHYDVIAYFNREKSWARDRSQALLEHEQLHFHIAELYARKIRKKIHSLASEGVKDIKVYNEAINKILQASNAEDERYDRETLHGALPRRQEAWTKKVSEDLTSLVSYKKKKRVIGLSELKRESAVFTASKQPLGWD